MLLYGSLFCASEELKQHCSIDDLSVFLAQHTPKNHFD